MAQFRAVYKGEETLMPCEEGSGWTTRDPGEEGLLVILDPSEKMSGGVVVPLEVLRGYFRHHAPEDKEEF